jgi:hypothetical protein
VSRWGIVLFGFGVVFIVLAILSIGNARESADAINRFVAVAGGGGSPVTPDYSAVWSNGLIGAVLLLAGSVAFIVTAVRAKPQDG